MRTFSVLLISLNLLSLVWSTERPAVWFGNVFTNVMNNFSINSNVIQNNQCKTQNHIFQTNFQNGTYWAVQMFDSSVKSVGGLFDGDRYDPGHPSQCVRVASPNQNISGKYCLVQTEFSPSYKTDPEFFSGRFEADFPPYNLSLNYWEGLRYKTDILWHNRTKFRWGICIPDACSHEDLWLSLNHSLVVAFEENNITLKVRVNANDCYTEKEMHDREIGTGAYVWISVVCFLLICMTLASIYDWMLRNDHLNEKQRMPKFEKFGLPFSLISNVERLCRQDSDEKFSVVYGMKALSMAILVLGHRGMVVFGNDVRNLRFFEESLRDIRFAIFSNGTIVVDTFLMLGGYLAAHQLITHLNKRGKVNLVLVYVDRILRLLPTYIFVITFYMYILPLIGEGPRWKEIILRESSRCQKNWWTNVLFINNFVDPSNMCMLQSWYLTADMQMFIFSVPIIYYIWAHPKLRVPVLSTFLALSVLLPSIIMYQRKTWGMFPMITDWFYDPPSLPYYVEFYIQPHIRAIPYIVGISGAFLSQYLTETKHHFSATFKVIFFILATISILGITFFYPAWRFYVQPYQLNVVETILFSAVHRLVWAIFLAFLVIIHTSSGYGPVSDILSVRLFVPISRISYSTFLVHIIIMLYTVSTDEQNTFQSLHKFGLSFLGVYSFSILMSFFVTLLVESPVDIYTKRLKNILLKQSAPPQEPKITETPHVSIPLPEINSLANANIMPEHQHTIRL